ncbi:Putative PAS domain-containing protein [Septoria linicola]|uniref:PAS domain-containing protein n=1 Tax=Septoria linicola TaxID=215465 RepID=A0A9Q9ECL6_9PEZI|nr:putative PAS domain-containing protein [Septoria linicola]USW46831.1 Putative PAS domain-containing protein [Septoria linicola]
MADAVSSEETQSSASPGADVAATINTPKLRRRSGSENMSGLRMVNVSPEAERRQQTLIEEEPALSSPTSNTSGSIALRSPAPAGSREEKELMSSAAASQRAPSVFDIPEQDELHTENTEVVGDRDGLEYVSGDEDLDSYNLKPPPPPTQVQQMHSSLESLSERFFSADHLDLILNDYALANRFTRFLQRYRPAHADTLKQYAEARKAIAAVEFANAVANQMQPQAGYPPFVAAKLDERFEAHAKHSVGVLVEEALSAYLTHRLVGVVTDTLAKEITGNSAPMHQLIPSLAEVYCISDPSVRDNPIVYASEEFYNITQYTKEMTIGRNCRFLQGPKSSMASVTRLIQALSRGEECCETILNYKRDGTPFMNLLMIAPLYDNKGAVRYFLGCQIDVSSLIDGGKGVESFAQLLLQDRTESRSEGLGVYKETKRDPKAVLSDFGQLLSEDEAEIVRNRAQKANSPPPDMHIGSMTSTSRILPSRSGTKSSRIVLGMDSNIDPSPERQLWPAANLGPSGRLPGVYQNYLLVRPYPSLRITFTSPSLRIPGLLQTKLLDRIGGPPSIREGLLDALSRATGVTARIHWLTSHTHSEIEGSRIRWLHCTPLLGSDERVGVWMIVIVEDENVMASGSLRRMGSSDAMSNRSGAQRFTSSRLYADYLRREGRESAAGSRPVTATTGGTSGSERGRVDAQVKRDADEKRDVDDQFRDF